MSTRKSMKLPIIITFIFILIIVYLFMNLKQSKVVCESEKSFDGGFRVKEEIESVTYGKKINTLNVTKTIYMADRYVNNSDSIEEIKDQDFDEFNDFVEDEASSDEEAIAAIVKSGLK